MYGTSKIKCEYIVVLWYLVWIKPLSDCNVSIYPYIFLHGGC